jgi:acyl dehydratase
VPRVAQSVDLDGVIAHGMLTMAFAGQLLTEWAGDGSVRKIKVRFSGMAAPGETVICRGKVTGKSVEDGKHILSGKLTVKGAEDGSLKLKGDFSVVVPKR